MSKSNNKTVDIISTIVAGVIIIGLGVWLINTLGSGLRSSEKKNEPAKVAKSEAGDSFDNPTTVNTDSLEMSGEEFASRYKNKWISFDGTLGATTKSSGNSLTPLRTDVGIGDKDLATFDDGSVLFITSLKMTFDDNLQEYAAEYSPEAVAKVHVVAQVTGYSNFNITMSPHSNTDGKSPSITVR